MPRVPVRRVDEAPAEDDDGPVPPATTIGTWTKVDDFHVITNLDAMRLRDGWHTFDTDIALVMSNVRALRGPEPRYDAQVWSLRSVYGQFLEHAHAAGAWWQLQDKADYRGVSHAAIGFPVEIIIMVFHKGGPLPEQKKTGILETSSSGPGSGGGDAAVVPVVPEAPEYGEELVEVPPLGEQALAAAEPPPDWSSFDLGRSLRQLRSTSPALINRALRMLHLRWFHCSAEKMHSLLKTAGVPTQVLQQVHAVCETCRVCRMWKRPGDRAVTSMRTSSAFGEAVQVDLLFVESNIILHMIDEATRFTMAVVIKTKQPQDLISAMTNSWFRLFGAPRCIISDREGGIASEEASIWAERWQTTIKLKAVGQHASTVERHHEVLRQQLHRLCGQARSEGLNLAFADLLSEAVLAKNALLTVHGTTPYEAVFGRRPTLLAELEVPNVSHVSDSSGGALSRHVVRARELSVQAIVEGTALERIKRAAGSQTRVAGQQLDLHPGDLVDIFRAPSSKDNTGWRGPCRVVSTFHLPDGFVDVVWQGRTMGVRIPDVRPALVYLELDGAAMSLVRDYAAQLQGQAQCFAWVHAQQGWQLSQAARQRPDVYHALLRTAVDIFHCQFCVGGRIGRGVAVLPGLSGISSALLVWWPYEQPALYRSLACAGVQQFNLQTTFGADWNDMCWVQFLMVDEKTANAIRQRAPDVPYLGDDYAMRPPDGGPAYPPDGDMDDYLPPQDDSLPSTRQPSPMPSSLGQPPMYPPWFPPWHPDIPPPSPAPSVQPGMDVRTPATSRNTSMSSGQGYPPWYPPWFPRQDPVPVPPAPSVWPLPVPSVGSRSRSTVPSNHSTRPRQPPPSPGRQRVTVKNRKELPSRTQYGGSSASTAGVPQQLGPWPSPHQGPLLPLAGNQAQVPASAWMPAAAPPAAPPPAMIPVPSSRSSAPSTIAYPGPSPLPSAASTILYPEDEQSDEDSLLVWQSLEVCKEPPRQWHEWSLHPGFAEVLAQQEHFLANCRQSEEQCPMQSGAGQDEELEIEFGPRMAAWLDVPIRQLQEDEVLIFKASRLKSNKPNPLIVKNIDAMTSEDVKKHWPLVEAAIRKEIKSFQDLETFKRAPRSSSRNICSSRWVLRWKMIDGVRSVKARLTIRGFEDVAQDIATYASTATRWGQRIICSIAIQYGWTLFTADVGAAFLRGMTFQELSKLTGQPAREVSFVPPKGSEQYFQELPGLRDLNFAVEVLRLLKPAYGLKDAPKAWRTRLDQALRSLGGRPLHTDGSLYVFFGPDKKLQLALSCHVDDLKGCGVAATESAVLRGLAAQFGELKVSRKEFDHCGIKYCQQTDKITLSQDHYAAQLRAIDTTAMGTDLDRSLTPSELTQYQSLLGGLSWLIQTRTDIAIYVCALQRAACRATVGHIAKLNKLVKWVRRKQCPLTYWFLRGGHKILVVSDAAFRKEEAAGLAMRGAMIGIAEVHPGSGSPGGRFHLMEFYARKQRRVVRSTFAAELQALADAYEIGRLVSLTVASTRLPLTTAKQLIDLEGCGGLPVLVEAVVDCLSVFAALAQDDVRTPSEASLVMILHGLKEALLTHNLRRLWWVSTFDMLADALNKGSVSRKALVDFGLSGEWVLKHAAKAFQELRHVPLSGIEAMMK